MTPRVLGRYASSPLVAVGFSNLCLRPTPKKNLQTEDTDPRDELGRSIRYAARLASFLAGKPHHPDLDELLKDLILDIEALWLVADECQEERT